MSEKKIDSIRYEVAEALTMLVMFSAWEIAPDDYIVNHNGSILLRDCARTLDRASRWCKSRALELRHSADGGDMAVTDSPSDADVVTDKKGGSGRN